MRMIAACCSRTERSPDVLSTLAGRVPLFDVRPFPPRGYPDARSCFMRKDACDPVRWNFVLVNPNAERRFRRTNQIWICLLAMLVFGFFVAVVLPQLG
jgi:hypothetical protein